MKKGLIFAVLVFMLAMSSVAMAAPTTDLQQGQVQLGVTVSTPSVEVDGNSLKTDTKLNPSLAVGITSKLQGQFEFNKTALNSGSSFTSNEIGVAYKVQKNLFATVAYENVKADVVNVNSQTKNLLVVGVTGIVPVADKVNAYGKVAFGKDVQKYAVGVTYDLAKNTMLTVEYADKQYKDFSQLRAEKTTIKGVSYGLVYKF